MIKEGYDRIEVVVMDLAYKIWNHLFADIKKEKSTLEITKVFMYSVIKIISENFPRQL